MTYETKPGVRIPTRKDHLPKRFYTQVGVTESADGFAVMLDGRLVRTPARKPLAAPTRALAEIIAAEWAAQGERINPVTMPATRLAHVALDRMGAAREGTIAEILRYAGADLLRHRAAEPAELVAAQAAAWDDLLAWGEAALGAPLKPVTGIQAADAPAEALKALAARAGALDDWRLTAFAHVTAVTGSAVLGLALLEGRIDGTAAFAASRVDEDFQISRWGEDAEAAQRAALLRADVLACEALLRAASQI